MKVLLIHPYWIETYGKYKEAAKKAVFYPPLGLCYLASCLIKNKHDVKIIDAEAEGKRFRDIIKDVINYKPDLVGVTSTSPIYHTAKKVAEGIKKSLDVPILIGGSHACVLPIKTLEDCKCFDFLILGEGEKTIVELADAIENKKSLKKIKGLVYRENEKIIQNEPRHYEKNLDNIPFPARHLLKLDKYFWSVPKKGFVKTTSIMTTRGCPFQCIYCSQRNVFGRVVRSRSPENIVKEFEEVVNKHGIKHFAVLDDTVTLDRDRIIKICNLLIKKNLNITWEGMTRANRIDEELLRIMKKSGLVRLSFGIESGNQRILNVIKKGITLEDIKKAYEITKKCGIETRGSAMIGLPSETTKEVMDTLKFIRKLKGCDQIYLNITTPYPGTELYDMAIKGDKGIRLLSHDFSQYKRYGGPVIEVNNLTRKKLIWLQKLGFLMFYVTPRRMYYNFKRAGFKAGFKNVIAFIKSVFS